MYFCMKVDLQVFYESYFICKKRATERMFDVIYAKLVSFIYGSFNDALTDVFNIVKICTSFRSGAGRQRAGIECLVIASICVRLVFFVKIKYIVRRLF
jgi:hypothetical protein